MGGHVRRRRLPSDARPRGRIRRGARHRRARGPVAAPQGEWHEGDVPAAVRGRHAGREPGRRPRREGKPDVTGAVLTFRQGRSQVDVETGGRGQRDDAEAGGLLSGAPRTVLEAHGLRKAYRGRTGRLRRLDPRRRGRGGRAPRAERRREDDDVLDRRRPRRSRRRDGGARRRGDHVAADVPAGAERRRLPAAGAVGLPEDDGAREPPRHPRDAARRRGRGARSGRTSCSTGSSSRTWRTPVADTLSGGERRRLEIARALTLSPRFILLDEPFAGIDPITVLDLQQVIRGLAGSGIGILMTDHNVRDTLAITDRAYIINSGKIFRTGSPDALSDGRRGAPDLPRREVPAGLESPCTPETGAGEARIGPDVSWHSNRSSPSGSRSASS